MFKQLTKKGISRFYTRTHQLNNHSTYYITPTDTCPLSVLNDSARFVVLAFDRDDDYIVVNGKRYYLNRLTALKATDQINPRVAVVDVNELEHAKGYDFDDAYRRHYTAEFDSFDTLHALAKDQYASNGAPYIKQVATKLADGQYDYSYEPSYELGIEKADKLAAM